MKEAVVDPYPVDSLVGVLSVQIVDCLPVVDKRFLVGFLPCLSSLEVKDIGAVEVAECQVENLVRLDIDVVEDTGSIAHHMMPQVDYFLSTGLRAVELLHLVIEFPGY